MFIPSRVRTVFALSLIAAVAAGCASGTVLRRKRAMGKTEVMATSADVRLVTSTPIIGYKGSEVVRTGRITCAEPSPDIAKIVSNAFGLSGSLAGKGSSPNVPAEMELNTAMALSKSYAEGVAQMTERLATIQLLRDGLYRACEAYSNGAITATTYAAMVSRYDKTMITLLMGELAAGAFGRSMAGLSSKATSDVSAVLTLTRREAELEQKVEDKEEEKAEAEETAESAESTPAEQAAAATKADEADKDIDKAEKELEAVRELKLEAKANTTASTGVSAGGAIASTSKASAFVASQLVQMQANYLNDHNVDAVKIGCLSAWARGDGDLARVCDVILAGMGEQMRRSAGRPLHVGEKAPPTMVDIFMQPEHATGPYSTPEGTKASWESLEASQRETTLDED